MFKLFYTLIGVFAVIAHISFFPLEARAEAPSINWTGSIKWQDADIHLTGNAELKIVNVVTRLGIITIDYRSNDNVYYKITGPIDKNNEFNFFNLVFFECDECNSIGSREVNTRFIGKLSREHIECEFYSNDFTGLFSGSKMGAKPKVVTPPSASAGPSIEDRLRKVKELERKGLISPAEAAKKRKTLLELL
jgi:hypothetical protein